MEKVLYYTLKEEDLAKTAGGLVNLVLKNCVQVTGHEISAAKFTKDGITCNGVLIHVSERMQVGQTLQVILPEEKEESKLLPVKGDLKILYEDEDLIAVDKKAGEVVHPGPGHYADTIANHLTWHLENDSPFASSNGGSGGLRVIGRLDKETSGVLLFAKNRAAAARLQKQRNEGTFVRTYVALCEGVFEEDEKSGVIDLPLEKMPDVLMKMRIAPKGEGLCARTFYTVLEERTKEEACSLLMFTIQTGRTHQIRVHMAAIGHPIVGDTLYGSRAPKQAHVKSMPNGEEDRALLHAFALTFFQPFGKERINIFSTPPDKLQRIQS